MTILLGTTSTNNLTPFPSFLSYYFQSPSIGRHRPRCIHSFTTLTDMAVSPIQIPTRRPPRLNYHPSRRISIRRRHRWTAAAAVVVGFDPSSAGPCIKGTPVWRLYVGIRRIRRGKAQRNRNETATATAQDKQRKQNEQLRWQLEIVSGTTRGSHWWSHS